MRVVHGIILVLIVNQPFLPNCFSKTTCQIFSKLDTAMEDMKFFNSVWEIFSNCSLVKFYCHFLQVPSVPKLSFKSFSDLVAWWKALWSSGLWRVFLKIRIWWMIVSFWSLLWPVCTKALLGFSVGGLLHAEIDLQQSFLLSISTASVGMLSARVSAINGITMLYLKHLVWRVAVLNVVGKG